MAESNGVEVEKSATVSSTIPNEEPTPLEKQIIRQIEYYFGDINLPKDKFLQEQIKLDEGWVPLDVMLTFKRLCAMTNDAELIVKALGKSTNKLMEVSEDGKKIRRQPDRPLPILNEERRQELLRRTIYVKGFPSTMKLEQLEDFFSTYGPLETIQMRSYRDKITNETVFKGSVFAMFETRDKAEEFLNIENLKYEDTELIRKWQNTYYEDKRKERNEQRMKRKGERKDTDKTEVKMILPKGAILHLKGIPAETSREQIKEKIIQLGGDVAFIEFNRGDEESVVRLQIEDSAKTILEKLTDNKLELNGSEVEVRAVEGEEEEKFLENAQETMIKRRNQQYNRRGGRKGGRGGKFGGKRKASPSRDAPPAKKETPAT